MNPRIKSVTPLEEHKLLLEFTNAERGIYDCGALLQLGVFRALRDESYFRQVRVEDGTVAWPDDQDICPDTLYIESVKMPERLPS